MLIRTGKQGYLQIDGGSVQHGQSQGKSIMVNTKGNIYLGKYNITVYLFTCTDQTVVSLLTSIKLCKKKEII